MTAATAPFEVMPGQRVTADVYEQVRDTLEGQAPNLLPGLTWEQFTHPGGGVFAIPDNQGRISKVELILASTPDETVKVNRWFLPDRRAGQRPVPHNHRWTVMRSTILRGGYTEERYRSGRGGVGHERCVHAAGGRNELGHAVFHEVVEILDPGETWTLMVCGHGQPGDWGYLDPDSGRYRHNEALAPDPGFAAAFRALNPHAA